MDMVLSPRLIGRGQKWVSVRKEAGWRLPQRVKNVIKSGWSF